MNPTKTDQAAQLRITAERFWRERAGEHAQRLAIIRLLASIDRKLALLVEERR
jgi:hypothetical protein